MTAPMPSPSEGAPFVRPVRVDKSVPDYFTIALGIVSGDERVESVAAKIIHALGQAPREDSERIEGWATEYSGDGWTFAVSPNAQWGGWQRATLTLHPQPTEADDD